MKKFDKNYLLLGEMYRDEYFPTFLVDKVKALIEQVIAYLETGASDTDEIQEKLDAMTAGINELQEEFEENGSELETVARDCIGVTVGAVLRWFDIDIDIETAIGERDW